MVLCAGGMHSTLFLLLVLQRTGSCIFCSESALTTLQLFLVPYSFFVFCRFEERCVQAQASPHCNKGSQVPACLTWSHRTLMRKTVEGQGGSPEKTFLRVQNWKRNVIITVGKA